MPIILLALFSVFFTFCPAPADNSLDLTDIPLSPTISQEEYGKNKKEIERLKQELTDERRKNTEIEKKSKAWEKKYQQLASEVEQLQKSNQILRTLNMHHAEERQSWQKRTDDYNDAVQKLREQLGKCDQSLTGVQAKLGQCGESLHETQKYLSQCRDAQQAASATANATGNDQQKTQGPSAGDSAKPVSVKQPATAREPFTGMEFVLVRGGCYQMGCGDWTSECDDDEKPSHEVCVDSFWLGKYEVTQKQWARLMGRNPAGHKNGPDYPVERVSWFDASVFVKKINRRTQRSFRLPSEAEWEYAARSRGEKHKYAGGTDIDALAHYSGNSSYTTHRVGTKRANELGIYDMSGNVWEWCGDWYRADYYASRPRDNPAGPVSGMFRVRRGGGFDDPARFVRASFRGRESPEDRYDYLGFRLAAPKGAFAESP